MTRIWAAVGVGILAKTEVSRPPGLAKKRIQRNLIKILSRGESLSPSTLNN